MKNFEHTNSYLPIFGIEFLFLILLYFQHIKNKTLQAYSISNVHFLHIAFFISPYNQFKIINNNNTNINNYSDENIDI